MRDGAMGDGQDDGGWTRGGHLAGGSGQSMMSAQTTMAREERRAEEWC
jgi:hypothetical protein